MKMLSLKAYAKVNLGLAVLGRRRDGFHELRTIYQSVSLADDVEVRLQRGSGISLESSGWPVPQGRENLVVRAAEAVLKALRLRRSVSIRLQKRIPPASGLGGASSDAAAVLLAIHLLAGEPLPFDLLLHLAAELGSDVPFFLVGGRAAGAGRGEEVYPLPEAPRRWLVIVFPGEGMSTAEAYRLLLRPRLTLESARPTIESFCAAALLPDSAPLQNDFEALLMKRLPKLAGARRALLQGGAEAVSLSGSGSALYGQFPDRRTAAGAAAQLRKTWQHVFLARTVSRREFLKQAV